MPRKTSDPRLIALLDQLAKAQADCDRYYARLKRAFNRHEKARRTVLRIEKRIDAHRNPTPNPEMTTP
ncbi:MAG TPA: hypothetical protein VKA46_33850 [Gemmataceae bacterium]|nr:hypothetical protein [Gemmataceae bacterium]